MINFFRKTRKKMADDNKPMKYMRYAIGEIVLVVIGILIALQINTWNNDRINKIREIEILTGLRDEFEYNLISIQKDFIRNNNSIQYVDKIITIIRSESFENNNEQLDSLLVNVGLFGSFDARKGFVQEIISSGKLDLLNNQKLKNQITTWSGLLEDANEDIMFRNDNYTHILMPYLIKYFPLTNGDLYKDLSLYSKKYVVKKLNKSPFKANFDKINLMEFENVLWHHKHSQDFVLLNDLEIEAFIESTIKLIKEELKSN